MKSVFVVCTASVAFWVAVQQLYRYTHNQTVALKKYSETLDLVWKIRAVQAGGMDAGAWVSGPHFVSVLADKLTKVSAFSVSFDESKVAVPNLKTPGQ